MRSFRKRLWLVFCGTGLAATLMLFAAEFPSIADNTIGGTQIEAALYRLMQLPGGAVLARRPPSESVAQLTRLVDGTPERSDLHALRAEEYERRLDISAAEKDWIRAAELATDKATAWMDLADFYHRRLQPDQELQALLRAAKLPSAGLDRFRPNQSQKSWRTFERALALVRQARLGPDPTDDLFQTWIERYSDAAEPYSTYLDELASERNISHAQALATRIAAQFPSNLELQIQTEAKIAAIQGGSGAELAAYERRFSALWPASLRTRYFTLLTAAHAQRRFLADARTAAARNPNDLSPVLRTFFYYEQSGNREAADRELLEWQTRRAASHSPLTADELKTSAALFERVGDYDESAHASYTLYSLDSASSAEKESALADLVSLLLDVPEQPLRLGRRDLSLYRNIAQIDRHPGFLNGILSLALNTTFPQYEYQNASQTAASYFHRASASMLIERMKQQFPASKRIPALEAKLFAAYAVYGQDDALIRLVPAWLKANGTAPQYVDSALLLADAYFRANRRTDEFALYDHLLTTLAARSDHVPIGLEAQQNARSPDYVRVLERYLSRLTQEHKLTDAIGLYKREIVRNPGDPGLYERLALFVEQNRLDEQLAQTYRAAFERFHDASWADRLARLYLRRKQYTSYQALLRRITSAFAGSDLAAFIDNVAPTATVTPVLYRQINLYAHQRFPHNLTFVRNLLRAYQLKATADPAAYEQLLRTNWFYDAGLRTQYFEYLTKTDKLQNELAALPALDAATRQANVAAIQTRAEGLAWLTNYEAGAPVFARLATIAPGDRVTNARAIAIERSLGASDPAAFSQAVEFAEQDVKAAPGDSAAVTRVGEIYADHELYSKAAPWWNRIATIHPGFDSGYLEAATVFWDYFQYSDALRLIAEARRSFRNPALFAYEAGAIYENQNDYARAVAEYIRASLEQPVTGRNALAEQRLLTLAGRQPTESIVEQHTAALVANGFDTHALQLRIAILDKQNKTADLHALLNAEIARAYSAGDADQIRQSAVRFGFDDTAAGALARIVALTADPVEKLKARVDRAMFEETHNDVPAAAQALNTLLSENPDLLGVIRANVDFYWRQKQYAKAVSTLSHAADRAQQPYKNQLRSEGAEKAANSGEYQTARSLLDQLLADDPFNSDLLARKADTYARAHDSAALAAFYDSELRALQNSSLPATEKAERVAGLRRGYISALIATGKFPEALDQYEQVLNQYPEDESLAREAARFAQTHNLADRLTAYYEKAVSDSPKNYRWPLVLARIDRVLGRYADALTAYDKAAYVRPDRTDLFLVKADLETRLGRFDAALTTYGKLYELSYHNRQYLAEQATVNARLGKSSEAVRLLRAAYVEPQPDELAGHLAAMRQLLAWHMWKDADETYRKMQPLLASNAELAREAVIMQVEALTSLHRLNEAFSTVMWAARDIKDFTRDPDGGRYSRAAGKAVHDYFTPDEKEQLAVRISRPGGLPSQWNLYEFANASGLLDVAAAALAKNSLAWPQLKALQNSRLAFERLARAAEKFSRQTRESEKRNEFLSSALDAYAKADDRAAELRIASSLMASGDIDPQRFAEIFVRAHGDLSSLAAHSKYADAVVQYRIARGSFSDADDAVRSRGRSLPAPWTNSYTALTGLYFGQSGPAISDSFRQILGPRTVDAELASLHDAAAPILRGSTWLYYAGRYGEYLSSADQADAPELLPAPLENAPAASNSYVQLGDTLRELKQPARALDEYKLALELSPQRSDVHDDMAQVALESGQKEQAGSEWRIALNLLADQAGGRPIPPQFFADTRSVLFHVAHAGFSNDLEKNIESILRAFVQRNGSYGVASLVEPLVRGSNDKQQIIASILQLARGIDLVPALNELLAMSWLPDQQKNAIHNFLIQRAQQRLEGAAGEAAETALDQLTEAQINYVTSLLTQNRAQDAWRVLQEIRPDRRPFGLVLKAAAVSGNLDGQLKSYEEKPGALPQTSELLTIASELSREDHADLALRVREFAHEHELENGEATASAYFGLAEVRLKQQRPSDANFLIESAVMNTGVPFQNLPEAVRLLEASGRAEDALRYANQWHAAELWNSDARFALARLTRSATSLNQIRQSNDAPYSTRVEAARAMRDFENTVNGADELALLTHKTISPAEASRPFYVAARVDAARKAGDNDQKLNLLREAIRLDPSLHAERLILAKLAFELNQASFGSAALESYGQSDADSPELDDVQELAAATLVQQHDFSSAIAMYDRILGREIAAPVRERVQKLRDEAERKQRLVSLNLVRQPVITEKLTQPGIVRRKLSALPEGAIEE